MSGWFDESFFLVSKAAELNTLVYEGKTDRIINKYIKKTKIPCVKQRFINYAVGDNTILNWINYKEAYYAKSGLKYFFKVIKKIIHK